MLSTYTTEINRALSDMLVDHSVEEFGHLDFDPESIRQLIDIGYETASIFISHGCGSRDYHKGCIQILDIRFCKAERGFHR